MVETSAPRPSAVPAVPVTTTICPYLLSEDGAWRASTPTREHRCTAVQPSAPLATEKQRRLCLADAHTTCSTYRAATRPTDDAEHAGSPRVTRVERTSGRTMVRTAPLVLDHGRFALPIGTWRGERGLGQGALVVLMAIAFVAIIVARLSTTGGDSGGTGGQVAGLTGTPHPSAVVRPSATSTPVGTATPRPSATARTSATPSATPKPTKAPAKPSTYKVQRGDTLSGIATRYGTTIAKLKALNKITDASSLRVGQVLRLR
jgi:LysM repeat protein